MPCTQAYAFVVVYMYVSSRHYMCIYERPHGIHYTSNVSYAAAAAAAGTATHCTHAKRIYRLGRTDCISSIHIRTFFHAKKYL